MAVWIRWRDGGEIARQKKLAPQQPGATAAAVTKLRGQQHEPTSFLLSHSPGSSLEVRRFAPAPRPAPAADFVGGGLDLWFALAGHWIFWFSANSRHRIAQDAGDATIMDRHFRSASNPTPRSHLLCPRGRLCAFFGSGRARLSGGAIDRWRWQWLVFLVFWRNHTGAMVCSGMGRLIPDHYPLCQFRRRGAGGPRAQRSAWVNSKIH